MVTPQTAQDIVEGVAVGVVVGLLTLGLFWLLWVVLV